MAVHPENTTAYTDGESIPLLVIGEVALRILVTSKLYVWERVAVPI